MLAGASVLSLSVLARASGAAKADDVLMALGRRLAVDDDETQDNCSPFLEAYYLCAQVDESVPDEPNTYYYGGMDQDFCETVSTLESSALCDDVETCATEYVTAVSCYSEAACDKTFACGEVADEDDNEDVATIAFYNVNEQYDEVCFEFGTTGALGQTSSLVAFGEATHVALSATARASAFEPYDTFVRVSETCGGTAIANDAVAEIYSTQSNLVSWGIADDDDENGYIQTLRLNGPERAVFFLNEATASSSCVFSIDGTEMATVELHAAATAQLSCSDLNSTVAVACGTQSASLALSLQDVCYDTSLHLVATTQSNVLGLSLFQASDSCVPCDAVSADDQDSGRISKKKKKKNSADERAGVVIAIIVCCIIVISAIIFVVVQMWRKRKFAPRRVCKDDFEEEVSNDLTKPESIATHDVL